MPITKEIRPKVRKFPTAKDGLDRPANFVICCSPKECQNPTEKIDSVLPGTAVRVLCNNESCTLGNWMHASCFDEWEDGVLSYLRSCGRARSWSEKQRMQNLWTKKGYDLAFKACDCRCEKGHLRKDLDYSTPLTAVNEQDDKKNRKNKKKGDRPLAVVLSTTRQFIPGRSALRPRTQSLSSTGSSPPPSSSPGSSHSDESVVARRDSAGSGGTPSRKFEFFADKQQAAAGNIFKHRDDLKAFNHLPLHKRNSYHIKVEDEGPYGNDETRCFVLSTLSSHKATSVPCVICGGDLTIYDRYPLVNGTFFISPEQYNGEITVSASSPSSVPHHNRPQYLNAVCMHCLEGETEIRCLSCNRPWNGRILQLGTMYSYDIFAAAPCCRARLLCKNCNGEAIDPTCASFQFFSAFSRPAPCVRCQAVACHFVKPLKDVYYPTQATSQYGMGLY